MNTFINIDIYNLQCIKDSFEDKTNSSNTLINGIGDAPKTVMDA